MDKAVGFHDYETLTGY